MLVIGPQAHLGDVEAEEVEVLLVELGLPHVDGEEAGEVEPAEDLPQVFAVLSLVNRADQNVVQINKNKVKPFH